MEQSMKFGSQCTHVLWVGGGTGCLERTRFSCTQELESLNGSFLNSKGTWFMEAKYKCGGICRARERRCCGWREQAVLLHCTQTPGITLLSQRGTACCAVVLLLQPRCPDAL